MDYKSKERKRLERMRNEIKWLERIGLERVGQKG